MHGRPSARTAASKLRAATEDPSTAGQRAASRAITATAEQLLRQVGLRSTAPRLKLIELFRAVNRQHLTAEQAHLLLRERNQDVALSTVYRVLQQLAKAGLLTRNMTTGITAVYQLQMSEPRDHLVCVQCRRVDEFFSDSLQDLKESIAASMGYALAKRQVTLYGCCPDCQKS